MGRPLRVRGRHRGHSITGHSGRYRHEEGCAAFREARTEAFWDRRGKGDSYKAGVYDPVVPHALAQVSANAEMVANVADAIGSLPAPVNELALQRIRRARHDADERLRQDLDTAVWRATWERLDAEEAEVRASTVPGPSRRDVAAHLADLGRLFAQAEPATQKRIAQALFKKVEVLGPNHFWLHPSEEAVAQGWATAMSGEFTAKVRRNGRGERGSPSLTHVSAQPSFALENVTGPPKVWPDDYRKAS